MKLQILTSIIAAIAFTAPAQLVIQDFTDNPSEFPTGNQGWRPLSSGGAGTVTIEGPFPSILSIEDLTPGSWGSVTYSYSTPIDISSYTDFSLSVAKTTGNESDFVFAMTDLDGTLNVWSIPEASMPSTLIAPTIKPISDTTYSLGGGVAGFDLVSVSTLQIWMNINNPLLAALYDLPGSGAVTDFHYHLDSISAVPEPGTYGLIAALGLIGFGAYRKFYPKAA